jgi:hypothetical protein
MSKERVCVRVPVSAIANLSEQGLTSNQQIAHILETFRWDTLPCVFFYDCRDYRFRQLTIQLSAAAHRKLKYYCIRNRKSKTVAIAQALEYLGIYQIDG